MKLTITLEFTEHDARVLRSHASVGRFFDAVNRVCDLVESDKSEEVMDVCEYLKQPLDSLHRQVREALVTEGVKPLWKQ